MKTAFSLPTDTSIAYERRFGASPERIWEAYTNPELVQQWLGYGEFTTCEMDMRAGGSFRWVWTAPEFVLGIHGDVLEADPPRRLVTTEYMSDTEFPPTRNVVEFRPDGDGTLMVAVIEYASAEARDGAYASGMAEGMEASFGQLDSLLS